MGYGINCDWSEEFKDYEKWENDSRRVIAEILEDEENPRFKEIAEKLGVYDDDKKALNEYWEETLDERTAPIYNTIYPLETIPHDSDILKVALNTNCTVMYNAKEDSYYLSLTGCGMNLSQDIALSYLWLEKWIPFELMRNVCTQEALSISKKEFKELKEAILEQAESYKGMIDRVINNWK